MQNCQEWFYLCCGFLGVILGLFAMTLRYNLKMSANQKEMKVKLAKQGKNSKKWKESTVKKRETLPSFSKKWKN